MTQTTLAALRKRFEGEPFARAVGLRLLNVAEGYALVEMTCTREMENIFSMVHGGAIFTLADTAFAAAVNAQGRAAVAINISITFMKAVASGTLCAEAREAALSNRLGSYTVNVTDESQALVAIFQGLAYRKSEPIEVPPVAS